MLADPKEIVGLAVPDTLGPRADSAAGRPDAFGEPVKTLKKAAIQVYRNKMRSGRAWWLLLLCLSEDGGLIRLLSVWL